MATMPQSAISASYNSLITGFREVADACYRAGKLNEAARILHSGTELIQQAAEGDVSLDDQARLALAYGHILVHRTFYANTGYELARATVERAKSLAIAANSTKLSADADDLLGLAHYNRRLNTGEGGYDEALVYFRRALVIRRGLNDTRGIAESLFHVGLIHERREERDEARSQYEAALQTATTYGHKLEESYARRHLAGIAQDDGNLDAALAGFQRSLTLREELGYRLLLPLALLAVGDVLLAQGKDAEALEHYQRAYDLAETMDVPLARLFSLLSLASVKQQAGDEPAVRDYYQRALVVAQSSNFTEGITAANEGLKALGADAL